VSSLPYSILEYDMSDKSKRYHLYSFMSLPSRIRRQAVSLEPDCRHELFLLHMFCAGTPVLRKIPLDERYIRSLRHSDILSFDNSIFENTSSSHLQNLNIDFYLERGSANTYVIGVRGDTPSMYIVQNTYIVNDDSIESVLLNALIKKSFSPEFRLRLYASISSCLIREDLFEQFFREDGLTEDMRI